MEQKCFLAWLSAGLNVSSNLVRLFQACLKTARVDARHHKRDNSARRSDLPYNLTLTFIHTAWLLATQSRFHLDTLCQRNSRNMF